MNPQQMNPNAPQVIMPGQQPVPQGAASQMMMPGQAPTQQMPMQQMPGQVPAQQMGNQNAAGIGSAAMAAQQAAPVSPNKEAPSSTQATLLISELRDNVVIMIDW